MLQHLRERHYMPPISGLPIQESFQESKPSFTQHMKKADIESDEEEAAQELESEEVIFVEMIDYSLTRGSGRLSECCRP